MEWAATLKARRITGGAVVTVARPDGRVHRHRVSLRRYNRLYDTLNAYRPAAGLFGRNGLKLIFHDVAGLQAARKWAAWANRRTRYWQ